MTSTNSGSSTDNNLPEWFHDYITTSDFTLFRNVMMDLTGESSLSIDDPRYLHILNLDIIPCLMILHHHNPNNSLLSNYWLRWQQHNPITKNLMTLMEITIKRLITCVTTMNRRFRLPHRNNNNSGNADSTTTLSPTLVKQCCNGLFFIIMMIQYLSLNVTNDEEMRLQLCVPSHWPEENMGNNFTSIRNNLTNPGSASKQTLLKEESPLIERLIENCIAVIAIPDEEGTSGMNDIKLFAVELLLSSLCCEPYKLALSSSSGRLLLQQFLFKRYGSELQKALSSRILSTSFLESQAVKLLKGLVQQSLCYRDAEGAMHSDGEFFKHIRDIWNKYKESCNEEKQSSSTNAPLYDAVTNLFSIFQLFWFATVSAQQNTSGDSSKDRRIASNQTCKERISTELEKDLETLRIFQDLPSIEISSLSVRSTQLLLLLIHQRRICDVVVYNPFREAFNLLIDATMTKENMSDEDSDIEVLDGSGHHSNFRGGNAYLANHIHMDFKCILQSLSRNLPDPNYVLLFYSFMQMHTTFVELLRSSDCTTPILLKCLQGLYESTQGSFGGKREGSMATKDTVSPNNSGKLQQADHTPVNDIGSSYEPTSQIYTLLIAILLIVQDPLLVNSKTVQQSVDCPWYNNRPSRRDKERQTLRGGGREKRIMPLIDVMVAVMLKASTYAIFRQRDQYMLSNIYAILMHLVPITSSLSPVISERLIKTIVSLCKRASKEYDKFNQAMNISGVDHATIADNGIEDSLERSGSLSPSPSSATLHEHTSSANLLLAPLARSTSESTIAYEESSALCSTYSPTQSQPNNTDSTCSPPPAMSRAHDVPVVDEVAANLHAETLALIRMGLKHFIDFSASVIRLNMSNNINLLYAVLLDHTGLSTCLSMELIQTLLIDDSYADPANATAESIVLDDHKHATDARYLVNLGKYFLRLFEGEEDEEQNDSSDKIEVLAGVKQPDAHRYYTASEAMEQLGLQVRILMNEVDSQVQQGILHNCQDLYSIFASEEFTCVIDWNTINHKLSSRNIKKDHHHNEATHRMKYLYKESENPDEFFLPYIWNNVIVSSPEMLWQLHLIPLSKS